MTAEITCSYCGTSNFEISAYCKKCERPLRAKNKIVGAAQPGIDPDISGARPPSTLRSRDTFIWSADRPRNTRTLQLSPATKWRSLLALAIDFLVVLGVGSALVLMEIGLAGTSFRSEFHAPLDIISEFFYWAQTPITHGAIITTFSAMLLTFFPQWRSPGQRVSGIVIVRKSGRPLSVTVLVLRGVAVVLTTASLGLGVLWSLFDPHGRCLHDLVAGTIAVRRRIAVRDP